MILQLFPAYGRRFTSEAHARASWCVGKSWHSFEGPYVSARDIPSLRRSGFQFVQLNWGGELEHKLIIRL